VETGTADLAIISWDGRDTPEQLEGEHLHSEEIILFASPDGPPDADTLSPREVAALPQIDIPVNVTFQRMLDLQLRRQGIRDRNVVIRLGHAESVKRMIRDHNLVAFLPRYVVDESLAHGEVREIEVPGLRVQEDLWLFTRIGKTYSTLHQACIETISGYLADRRDAAEAHSSQPAPTN
jgi:LysR family transcriptional regulator, low CO2-responsive transcriptional regulator